MHDPKFENEVQKKLEELSFSPSEAVWTRVEQAVNEKRRRRIPLFWFFILPLLGLTGAGIFYFSKSHTTSSIQVAQKVTTPASADHNTSPDGATATGKTVTADRTVAVDRTDATDRNIAPDKGRAAGRTTSPGKVSANRINPSDRTIAPDKTTATITTSDRSATTHRPAATGSPVDPALTASSGNEHSLKGKPPVQDKPALSVSGETSAVAQTPAITETSSRTASPATLPALTSFNHHYAAPAASSLPSKVSAASPPINLKPKYFWETGFAGGIGLSSLNTGLFQQPAGVANDLMASSPTPVNAYGSARPKAASSTIKPAISYWAGIVAQRPLSRSLTLSLGLDFHYYSARVQVGETVYNNLSSFYTASTLINSQTPRVVQSNVYPYYAPGDAEVFVNRYYFLELPVSIMWQINHSRKLPLFWENGLSLSYLVSTNSLYYNSKSGVFYKDQGNMTNKTQLNLATAVLVGLPVRNLRLQVGPQVQYGLTGLQHQTSNSQHLFYGGIRLVLLPGRSKK